MKTPPSPDDWRRMGQDEYLKGLHLHRMAYTPYRPGWDHDHCEFCSQKISQYEGDQHEGYSTDDQYHWICVVCFEDFRMEFGWIVD